MEISWIPTDQFQNVPFLTVVCKNDPIKSNWLNPALCLIAPAKKYFKFLMEAVGDQVSTIKSLFCRYTLTTIINFNLLRLPLDWIFYLYKSIHGVTWSNFSGSSTNKFRFLIKFSTSLRVAFSQGFLMYDDNLVASENS